MLLHNLTRYTQDVSRLVDLCRQSIVFKDLSDLLACLRAVEADPGVQVESQDDNSEACYLESFKRMCWPVLRHDASFVAQKPRPIIGALVILGPFQRHIISLF